ncbi:hypothetical protein CXF83_14445 [Shewanella sp. Choline-02u-19]|uniref:M61 family metallopeptidase n=1 Tax=unclassified Shewanella TaxID=196818 RepID=UPI000C33EAC8|nr:MULTISPECIES: hypothetical protein [unclassified Shewanella]PKH57024.1 hypothetical protein CXF84_11155 [Shewanella sp. Bg11-22]PKI27821.1 hypothetical protein CXF83_14445 [Shewanella sp. Choline-02u-19]
MQVKGMIFAIGGKLKSVNFIGLISRLLLGLAMVFILLLVPLGAYSKAERDTTEVLIQQSHIEKAQLQKMKHWLENGVKVVELTLGPMPADRLNVELVKKSFASEPVPFAQVIRGDPNKVKLQVNPTWPLQNFVDDWTLYHELSHLYLPYLNYSAFWLNEGFATYMQNVSMLNGGVIDKKAFMQKVLAGLERGRKNTLLRPGKLSDVSADMWRQHAYMRVYWTGTAFFVEVDLLLMQQGSSLAAVVGKYSQCCLAQESTGEALMQQLDAIADTRLFYQTYRRYIDRQDFPMIKAEQLQRLARYYSSQGSLLRHLPEHSQAHSKDGSLQN